MRTFDYPVTLSPSSRATVRTKNRLREHGPTFTIRSTGRPICMNGELSLSVRSEDGWFGWLILDEVEIVTEE